jgi:hypothetical protein
VEALRFQLDVVKGKVFDCDGKEVVVNDITLRQISAKDILSLGHAKAIEKSVNMTGSLEDALALIEARKKGVVPSVPEGA